ncbi:MAG: iron-only hydrogenase system regulator [Eggerthellaceae bacterium]|nr:iron-only hydrogenase system regulator [Eggerthellaceae bacterium]
MTSKSNPADFEKANAPEGTIALVGIIVENQNSTEKLNSILHDYRAYIIGRMGIPCPDKNVSVISIALDAPRDVISALAGKVGMLEGVSSKTVVTKTGPAA